MVKERMNKPVRGFLRPKLPKRFSGLLSTYVGIDGTKDSSYRERFQASFYCTYYLDYVLKTERPLRLLLMF